MEPQKVSEIIETCINNVGFLPKQTANELTHMHPTLQQEFFNLAVAFVVEMSKKEDYGDLRNSASIAKAKRIVSAMTYEDKEGLCPFI